MGNFYVVHPSANAEGNLTGATIVPASSLPQTISGLPSGTSYRVASLNYAAGTYTTFSPLSLFAAGEQGAWYDPSDITTLFQDAAGTTPVTAAGQPVGRINDKSGRGNHATTSISTTRPIYQIDGTGKPYLLFDGTDDWLVTSAINAGSSEMQIFAGVRKLSDANTAIVAEFGSSIPNGGFYLAAPNTGLNNYGFSSRGTTQITFTSPSSFAAPRTDVITGIGSITAPTAQLRIDGAVSGQNTSSQGTGPYGNLNLNIGRRAGGTVPFNGQLYGLVLRFGAALDATTIQNTETWLNNRTGAY